MLAERGAPGADLLLTNSQLAMEAMRGEGVFEPYAAPVAERYAAWLRAPDLGWLSFTAWPRVVMASRTKLGDDPAGWPNTLEELTDPHFRDALACVIRAAVVQITHIQPRTSRVRWPETRPRCYSEWSNSMSAGAPTR